MTGHAKQGTRLGVEHTQHACIGTSCNTPGSHACDGQAQLQLQPLRCQAAALQSLSRRPWQGNPCICAGEPSSSSQPAPEEGKPAKKAKKEKSKTASAAEQPSSSQPAAEEEKSAKKAKKEKSKKLAASIAEEPSSSQPEAKKEKSKKAKTEKSKKPAASAEEVAGALRVLASVGDATLAQNGKKIVKALYKEHPEVKSMTVEQVLLPSIRGCVYLGAKYAHSKSLVMVEIGRASTVSRWVLLMRITVPVCCDRAQTALRCRGYNLHISSF